MDIARKPTLEPAPYGNDCHSFNGFDTKSVTAKYVALAIAVSLSGLSTIASAASRSPTCETPPGGIMFITQDCIDPQFDRPVIDSREDLKSPVLTHRISGHFEGTDVKFSFFFPPKAQWKGRFFHKVYPLGDGSVPDRVIKFGADSGAYTVDTVSPSGYRANAAVAKFSKVVAGEYYGLPVSQIHGYIYGGSGGSYLTIAAAENSTGVWDGLGVYQYLPFHGPSDSRAVNIHTWGTATKIIAAGSRELWSVEQKLPLRLWDIRAIRVTH